jgi:GNAT superfamily N-acetyltransferase
MSFIIRDAVPADMISVLSLIKELAEFENEPNAVIIDKDYLIQKGFKPNPSFQVFVAELNNEIVGMALFYPRFSTWKGKTLHLEDLIVKQNKRGLGIGKALYSKFLNYAYTQKVNRVEWVVLDWNEPAIEFYKKSGATIFDDWRTVQMNEEQLKAYVKKNKK